MVDVKALLCAVQRRPVLLSGATSGSTAGRAVAEDCSVQCSRAGAAKAARAAADKGGRFVGVPFAAAAVPLGRRAGIHSPGLLHIACTGAAAVAAGNAGGADGEGVAEMSPDGNSHTPHKPSGRATPCFRKYKPQGLHSATPLPCTAQHHGSNFTTDTPV